MIEERTLKYFTLVTKRHQWCRQRALLTRFRTAKERYKDSVERGVSYLRPNTTCSKSVTVRKALETRNSTPWWFTSTAISHTRASLCKKSPIVRPWKIQAAVNSRTWNKPNARRSDYVAFFTATKTLTDPTHCNRSINGSIKKTKSL